MNEVKARQSLLLMKQADRTLDESIRLLEEALGEDGGIIDPPDPPKPPQGDVVYGRNGYTDSSDPRAQNARAHTMENGLVTGVHLQVHTMNQYAAECENVTVIKEGSEKAGQHVAIVHQIGSAWRVGLFTGYGGNVSDLHLSNIHQPGQEIVISSKFNPPELGGLAIALIDDASDICSDVVASIGLPYGHHVSYTIAFSSL